MSFYLRKSIGVGPLRVSMSRSGLGASVGVPGLRVGAGPRGAYVSLAGGLVSYRTTSPRAGRRPSAPSLTVVRTGPAPSDVVLSDVSGATVLEMTEGRASDLVDQLNEAARAVPLWPWSLVLAVVLAVVSPFLLLVGVPLTVWLYWRDRVRRTVVAFYDVQGSDQQSYQALVDAFEPARNASRAWHVVAAGAVSTTYQHKVNAGASALVQRLPVVRGLVGPPHLRTNIAVPSLTTSRRSVHFLPDRLLVRDGRQYADVAYDRVAASASPQRFIENGAVPVDSTVVDHTWQYVNKNGGPDRRFSNNRRLPVVQYGQLTLAGDGGYSALYDFSAPTACSAFAAAVNGMYRPHPHVATAASRSAPRPVASPRPSGVIPPQRGARTPVGVDAVHRRTAVTPGGDVVPPPGPTGWAEGRRLTRRRLSADGRLAVVGESHYQGALARAARGTQAGASFDDHLPVTAVLVPEPENPVDPHAVRVDVLFDEGSRAVGHLARADARRYQPILLMLRDTGYLGTCPARVAGGGAGRSYGLYLHVAGPEAVLIENLVDDVELLAPEKTVTVTREEDHQAALARHHTPARLVTRVVAELCSSTVARGKNAGRYAVEVRIDGDRVGELTATMSARYRPYVDGHATVRCEALATYGNRGYQIDLRLPTGS